MFLRMLRELHLERLENSGAVMPLTEKWSSRLPSMQSANLWESDSRRRESWKSRSRRCGKFVPNPAARPQIRTTIMIHNEKRATVLTDVAIPCKRHDLTPHTFPFCMSGTMAAARAQRAVHVAPA